LLKALTETLRSNGGIAGLMAYGAVLEAKMAAVLSLAEARARVRAIARSQEQTPYALVVQKAVERCLAENVSGAAALVPGAITVAEAVCCTLMETELFGRVRPAMVGAQFPDHAAFDRYVADCRELLGPQLVRVSENLSRDPTAARLRAPPTRRRRAPTATILNTSIL
jgi:hypothetical protein